MLAKDAYYALNALGKENANRDPYFTRYFETPHSGDPGIPTSKANPDGDYDFVKGEFIPRQTRLSFDSGMCRS